MKTKVVLFNNNIGIDNNNFSFYSEVAEIFNLKVISDNTGYMFVRSNEYQNAVAKKLKGEFVYGTIRLDDYTLLDRFNEKFVEVVSKYYPTCVETININYGDKYRLTLHPHQEEIEILDLDEWLER